MKNQFSIAGYQWIITRNDRMSGYKFDCFVVVAEHKGIAINIFLQKYKIDGNPIDRTLFDKLFTTCKGGPIYSTGVFFNE